MGAEPLQDAFQWAAGVMGRVQPEQLSDPSTCNDWPVRNLINHMIGTIQAFDAGVPEGAVSPQVDPNDDLFDDDPVVAYNAAWPGVVAAWAEADPQGAIEF